MLEFEFWVWGLRIGVWGSVVGKRSLWLWGLGFGVCGSDFLDAGFHLLRAYLTESFYHLVLVSQLVLKIVP